ncbi:MAG: hypothetical protein Greene101449_1122 [Candidatus Peregrinibacteria bacterium Greene1014_49]|nr:MAG: hypothetical protein Greene101449_1122 [Candidatus Peregrinibacteria bacterium Greene1014_49]
MPEHIHPLLPFERDREFRGGMQIELISPCDPTSGITFERPITIGDATLNALMDPTHVQMVMSELSVDQRLAVNAFAFARRYASVMQRLENAIKRGGNILKWQRCQEILEDAFPHIMAKVRTTVYQSKNVV